eukprot:3940583-Rhodomonas_salina.1
MVNLRRTPPTWDSWSTVSWCSGITRGSGEDHLHAADNSTARRLDRYRPGARGATLIGQECGSKQECPSWM